MVLVRDFVNLAVSCKLSSFTSRLKFLSRRTMARHFGRLTPLAIIAVASVMQAFAQTPAPDGSGLPTGANLVRATLSPTALSERVVEYEIDARYNAERKSLDATETLTYHNLTGQPLDTFPFHLYLNAFQPTSTFMREVRLDKPSF